MHKRLINGLLVAVSLVSAGFAQNARIGALGGINITTDPANVFSLPAYMNDYPDFVQATGGSDLSTSFIGIKSLGEHFSLGIVGLKNNMLDDGFYSAAIQMINASSQNVDLKEGMPLIPHALVGLNFGTVQIGADVYLELNKAKYTFKAEESSGDIKEVGKVSNFGLVLNANLLFGDFRLSPVFGMSIPSAKYKLDVGNESDEVKLEKGTSFKFGAEVGLPLFDIDWVAGFMFNTVRYQFVKDGVIFTSNFVNPYLGFEYVLPGDILFVGQYDLGIDIDKQKPDVDDNPTVTKNNNVSHLIAFGLEKDIVDVWIFDMLTVRGGINWVIGDNIQIRKNDDIRERIDNSTDNSDFSPTVGLGLKKGIFTFDVVSRLGGWTGIISGPPVVAATITLDFGSKDKVSSNRSAEPVSQPAYQQPSTPSEPQGQQQYDSGESGYGF
ncbi:MAG: hypothetical protein Q4F84_07085 [Fibrobacter sp.]|nr:hypothetical protein [Fibrobacter sp.]